MSPAEPIAGTATALEPPLPDIVTAVPLSTSSPLSTLATLYQIGRHECDVVLIAAQTALYRLPPRSYLAAHTFFLTTGEKLDVDALRDQLALAGYTHVTQVVSPGEFSVRGGLIDLYPMGSALPFRIDRFGDEIESIK